MTPLCYEMTQGDAFYAELAFEDQYGVPVDLSTWTLSVNFKTAYSDPAPFLSLTIDNGGLSTIDTGVIALEFPASAASAIAINPSRCNGDLIPWRWVYGDMKLIPPVDLEFAQADGARTPILIKMFAGIS